MTDAEQQHIDRVWGELVMPRPLVHRRRALVAVPAGRLWYFDPPRLPERRKVEPIRRAVGGTAIGSARFHPVSANRKLGPVDLVAFPGQPRPRPIARRPFVSATYASIEATCPDSCAFKRSGCFADSGFTKMAGQLMDAAASGRASLDVIREEARLIRRAFAGAGRRGRVPQDGARGGRDLRLHVGGDIDSADGAALLGAAARNWRWRGGGAVWTFTHRWQTVPRAAWGPGLQVFASIEAPQQIAAAAAQGYASALVVDRFEQDRAYPIAKGWKLIPCPAETRGATCASCRICLDRDVLGMRAVIGFQVHGTGAAAAKDKLVQLRRTR